MMRRVDVGSGGFESNGLEAFIGTDRDHDGLSVFGMGIGRTNGTCKWDEPEFAEGALETSDRALDRTGPRLAGAADSTLRWVELVSRAGADPATVNGGACRIVAIIKEQVEWGITMKGYEVKDVGKS
ncbi:hypothetical protein EDC04DRAFT_2602197 [Pisolithus marmoratus]|nr:hypothetical protein EDC04DRAFT_2602197 [Pisolithus marmoratus]